MKYAPPHEMIDADGNLYQIKKPLHKQPLFWISVISSGLAIILSLVTVALLLINFSLSENSLKINGRMDRSNRAYDYKNEHPNHYFGDAVFFQNGTKITVQAAKTDTSKKMSDDAAGVAVVVSVKVKNTSNRRILLNPYDFNLYDEKGNLYILDGSTFDHAQVGMNIIPGKTISFDLVFDGEKGDEHSYTVTYGEDKWMKPKSKK